MAIQITTPFTIEAAEKLSSGEIVEITGVIYTARDAAHKRMWEEHQKTGTLPIPIENSIVYYAGPAPAKKGEPIGSIGPTTSYRMDSFSPYFLALGQRGMIGKGKRSQEVIEAMKKEKGVYFGATGGAGALLASHVKKAEVAAYEDLGAEAIYKLYVEKFPAIVVIDSKGNNLYETEKEKYQE